MRRSNQNLKFHFFSFFVLILLLQGCSSRPQRFDALDYFPLDKDNQWFYNGGLQVMTVKDVNHIGKSLKATIVFSDTFMTPLWYETYRQADGQLQWMEFHPANNLLPSVTFDPPLPAGPFSNIVGKMREIQTVEIRVDSTGATMHVPLVVAYRIEAVENIETPVGTFSECLKMTAEFQYPAATHPQLFVGKHTWWFAKSIGPVKYALPSAHGELIGYKLH